MVYAAEEESAAQATMEDETEEAEETQTEDETDGDDGEAQTDDADTTDTDDLTDVDDNDIEEENDGTVSTDDEESEETVSVLRSVVVKVEESEEETTEETEEGDTNNNYIASGTYESVTWSIDSEGKLTVTGTGNFTGSTSSDRAPWKSYASNITSAVVNLSGATDLSYMFYNCSNLLSVDLSNLDTSAVTSMLGMFYNCSKLTSVDLSNLDTSAVTSMLGMFYNCSKLTSVDLSNLDTSAVTSMSQMFYGCSNLTNLDVSNFNTSAVTSMSQMFYGCSSLTSLDLSSFDMQAVNYGTNMLYGATGLAEINAPLKLSQSLSVSLPDNGTWYRADSDEEITALPTGLTETVKLYNPDKGGTGYTTDDDMQDSSASTGDSAASSSTTSSSSTSSSSSSSSSSSDSSASSASSGESAVGEVSLSAAAAGQAVKAATVPVIILSADGTAIALTLDTVIASVQTLIENAAAGGQAVLAVRSLMTTAPTEFFTQTVEALAEMKGSEMIVNNCGTVKTAATAVDAYGNNIASAGVIENVTTDSLVMLIGVNADGTVEYVEGVVDPVTGAVMGIFEGLPVTITVLVFA